MAVPTSRNKAPPLWRWYILFLACMVTFGGYYSFDFPSALHGPMFRHFADQSTNLTQKQFELAFSLFFSLYSLPNMILPWLGGMVADQYGNNRVMIAFGLLVLLGNVIQTAACYRRNIIFMIAGRFVFGLGAETLQVCANTTISKWFSGKDLALSMGINLSACKLGGVLTAWLSPYLAKSFGVDGASLFVSILCTVCFLLTLLLFFHEPVYSPDKEVTGDMEKIVSTKNEFNNNNYHSIVELAEKRSTTTVSSSTTSSYYYEGYSAVEQDFEDNSSVKDVDRKPPRHPPLLYSFSVSVWLVFVLTFIMYGTFIPFSNISNAVIMETYFREKPGDNTALQQQNEIEAAK